MAQELEKSYNPSSFEDRIYDFWMKGGYFKAKADPDKKPYTIVSSAGRECPATARSGCPAPTTHP